MANRAAIRETIADFNEGALLAGLEPIEANLSGQAGTATWVRCVDQAAEIEGGGKDTCPSRSIGWVGNAIQMVEMPANRPGRRFKRK